MTLTRRHLLQTTGASALLASIGPAGLRAGTARNRQASSPASPPAAPPTPVPPRRQQAGARLRATPAVVENRTGAGGQIAVTYVKGQPADGATILQTPTSILTIYPHIYKKLPYDPLVDLTPVTIACVFDFGFAVGPAVPASVKTVPEFLAWAKANPSRRQLRLAGGRLHAALHRRAAGQERRRRTQARGLPRHAAGHARPAGRQHRGGVGPDRRHHAAPGHGQGAHPGRLGRQAQPLRARRADLRGAGHQGHGAQRMVRLPSCRPRPRPRWWRA